MTGVLFLWKRSPEQIANLFYFQAENFFQTLKYPATAQERKVGESRGHRLF